ncbi:hypothetical protein C8035_v012471 [Colletotrichum spinosum]|uniref:Uncharacterized protein n=1 Tax=Colletotrichum spinosum TaxID=1347390 RepID=A0A4R8Q2W4_9PEZI|nr:hypothetical protein C8035_v012471 [Colletotrichum spinosum]
MPSQNKIKRPSAVPSVLPDDDVSSTVARSGSPTRPTKTKKHGKKGRKKGKKSGKKDGSEIVESAGYAVACAGAQFD